MKSWAATAYSARQTSAVIGELLDLLGLPEK
jgi:hypothetical protein